jgi:hypothetical protein
VPSLTDLTVASSSAGVTSGSSNCSSNTAPATGGGWIPALTSGKATFGFTGKNTTSGDKGHVLFVDHATGTKVEGAVDTFTSGGNLAHLEGAALVNGQPNGRFVVDVQDNGQNGSTDFFQISFASGTGTTTEGNILGGGNVQIHKPCK